MKNRMRILQQIATLTVRLLGGMSLVLACSGVSAALHCEHPRDAIETRLCSYTWSETGYTFEDLDVSLNDIYQAALDRVPDKDKLRTEQRAWLKVRDKCTDAKCFNDTYDKRIRELAVIPGKSVVNDVAFFGANLGIDEDPQVFELVANTTTWLLTRNRGLKHFDAGINDFDILGRGMPLRGTDPNNQICNYVLFGVGKIFTTSCLEPTSPDGGVLNMSNLPSNRRDGFDAEHEPQHKFLTTDGLELETFFLTETKLFTEASGSKCEPLTKFLDARVLQSQKLLWRWVYFYETPFLARSCRFSNKIGAQQVKIKNTVEYGPDALLPGGDVLVGLVRIDPKTGLPRDRSRVAAITKEQALNIKRKLINEYLDANPACQGKPEQCPDPSGALQHLWQRLPDAMKPYYVPAK